MAKQLHIGFPAPLLGFDPVRLPVLFHDGSLIVLMKPAGLLVQVDSWYPKLPVLVEAIRYQAMNGKPELARLGISESGLWSVTDLDPECAGPVLFSTDRNEAEELRNLYGSNAFSFGYTLISRSDPHVDSQVCDLPLARHRSRPCMLVSHTTGKKCQTEFKREEQIGTYTRWTANTTFPRRHQIPLHAYESGIPILGDRIYARSQVPYLSSLKRDYRPRKDREERPLFDGSAYFLHRLTLHDGRSVDSPAPARWDSSLRQLAKYSRPD